jgi:hypothetical protein
MGLDLRLCACNHLVKAEAAEVKNAVCDAYVKYGMNVFEHDHAEKQRMREEEADEVTLDQTEGVIRKKDHTDPDREAMTLGDDEAEEVTLVSDATEDDLDCCRNCICRSSG